MVATLDFGRGRVLRTEEEYDAAVREVDRLLDASPAAGTRDYDRLELLSVLIEVYDEAHYPAPAPGAPQSVVDFMLEQKGMTRAQLAVPMGGRSRVSDFFKGNRDLSVGQIRALRDLLGIPADLLLPPVVSKRRGPVKTKVRKAETKLGRGRARKKAKDYRSPRMRTGAGK
jgi:HTH-type transcriptional regulator/antitoxin HigA